MNFNEIRGLYEVAREKEKNNIIDWLVENNFIILNMNDKEAKKPYQTGSGSRNYTARKTIKKYDLSNWKWISAKKGEWQYIISLQTFDIDPENGDRHVLMDRLGIYKCNNGKYNSEECFQKMINTGIDLPMTLNKFKDLKSAIDKVDNFKQ